MVHSNKNSQTIKIHNLQNYVFLYVGSFTKFQPNQSDNMEHERGNSFMPFSKVCQ